jgi:hypothetical protein
MKLFLTGSLLAAFISAFFAVSCRSTEAFTKFKTDSDVPRINVADAKLEFDAGTAAFIDSRSEDSFKFEHISGAVNIPFGSQDSMMDRIPKGKKLIIYCS